MECNTNPDSDLPPPWCLRPLIKLLNPLPFCMKGILHPRSVRRRDECPGIWKCTRGYASISPFRSEKSRAACLWRLPICTICILWCQFSLWEVSQGSYRQLVESRHSIWMRVRKECMRKGKQSQGQGRRQDTGKTPGISAVNSKTIKASQQDWALTTLHT